MKERFRGREVRRLEIPKTLRQGLEIPVKLEDDELWNHRLNNITEFYRNEKLTFKQFQAWMRQNTQAI